MSSYVNVDGNEDVNENRYVDVDLVDVDVAVAEDVHVDVQVNVLEVEIVHMDACSNENTPVDNISQRIVRV